MSEMVTIERRAAVEHLLQNRDDMLVVCGLGSSTYDVYAAGDHHANFYLWGAMGGAVMIGLGLASSSRSLSSISTNGSFIFTRVPSTTCHCRT